MRGRYGAGQPTGGTADRVEGGHGADQVDASPGPATEAGTMWVHFSSRRQRQTGSHGRGSGEVWKGIGATATIAWLDEKLMRNTLGAGLRRGILPSPDARPDVPGWSPGWHLLHPRRDIRRKFRFAERWGEAMGQGAPS